ncbi:unnamed protein product [Lepeophtheirus salmonis]|uniref:(salmon louse) hypothetical protein n=1 Tax=Lepeophtheirus salmonis TaxID=72036 RepID=A0A7R8H3A3_LEPSM|nr:unnamed protein product [Lepeophtheirus salmonis]CAF2841280.1 unnamed protein product [Lepeophtheirus salmonis]
MTEGPPTPTSSSGVLLLGETEYVTVLESMVPTYSIPATVECSTESTKKAPLEAPDLPLKPVKVDNWVISFPIHRLVFEAATDWLVPHQTQVARGIIDMPHNFTPDVVRPVVNFMYTGRLTTGNASYDRIKETAELLRMSVLIKLIDDAKTRTNERPPIKKNTSDPVRQIKRIKTIEKKLPFWKKRTIPVNSSTVSINNSENTTTSTTTTTLPIQISNSNVHPELEKTLLNDLDHGKIPASSNTIIPNPQSEHNCSSSKDNNQKPMSQHQSQNSDGEIQSPQIPTIIYKRKITSESDMNQRKGPDSQQAVLFDHVRETGSKKQTKSSTNSLAENPNNEDNVKTPNDIDESMKELLEEQRKRLTLRQENSDNEEDDHHNQDDYVGGDDEYYLGFVAKKSLPVSESVPVAPSKVVRFSLTPSSNSSFNYKTQNTIFDEVKSNTNMESHSLDLPPPPSSQSLSQPNTMPPPDSPKKDSKPSSKSDTVIKVYSDSGDKKQVISEVLKKNPGLLKNHRQVKLKIMTKDSDNKQSVQCVTLRASESSVNIPSVIKNTPDKRLTEKRIRIMNNLNGDYKHSPKVMYTGHRKLIKDFLEMGFYETKGKQDPKTKVSGQIQHITTQAFQPVQTLENTPIELSSSNIATKPSTEAEAMSKVASGIATSIYLVPPDFVEGSATSNGGSNFMGASHSFPISMNEDVIISKNDLSSSNLSKKNPNPNLTEERSTDLDKVSALVLEWDEEDEEEEQKLIKKTLKYFLRRFQLQFNKMSRSIDSAGDWNRKMMDRLWQLYLKGTSVDLSLVSINGDKLRIHSSIFYCCCNSPIDGTSSLLSLRLSYSKDIIEKLVEFLYTGSINDIYEEDVESVFKLAEILCFKELKDTLQPRLDKIKAKWKDIEEESRSDLTYSFDPVIKPLTSTEVFLKYKDSNAQSHKMDFTKSTLTSRQAKKVADLYKRNPKLFNKPVKIKLSGGKTSLEIIQTPNSIKIKDTYKALRLKNITSKPDCFIPPEGPWNCQLCSPSISEKDKFLSFDSYYECRNHLKTVHGKKFDSRICEYCGYKSYRRTAIFHHAFMVHGISPPKNCVFPKCNECEYIAANQGDLQKHKKIHESKNEDNDTQENNSFPESHQSAYTENNPELTKNDYSEPLQLLNLAVPIANLPGASDSQTMYILTEDPSASQYSTPIILAPDARNEQMLSTKNYSLMSYPNPNNVVAYTTYNNDVLPVYQ